MLNVLIESDIVFCPFTVLPSIPTANPEPTALARSIHSPFLTCRDGEVLAGVGREVELSRQRSTDRFS